MRSDAKKRDRNQSVLSEIHTLSKKLAQLSEDPAKAKAMASELVSCYDKAVGRGIIPRGRADRRKSRIAHFMVRIQKKK